MAIKRAKRRTNFTMISNVGLRDERLSYKSKGLLAYMLSLPDDWVFYESELVNHSIDGKASVKSGLKELQEAGYLTRQRKRNDKGHLKETLWEISDEPMSDYPTLEKPMLEKPTLDNQPLLNTNITKDLSKQNTNETKDTMSGKPDDGSSIPYKEIITYLNQKADRKYKHTTPKTKQLIKARWNEGFQLEEFKAAIDNQVRDWAKDSDMNKYLRPETLFGTKFEGYLNNVSKNGGGSDGSEYDGLF